METDTQSDSRDLAEAGDIANRLNAMGLAAGPSLTEQWRTGMNKRKIVCVEIMTCNGFAHADGIRESLTQKNIIADKSFADILVVYGNARSHHVQVPVHRINRQAFHP